MEDNLADWDEVLGIPKRENGRYFDLGKFDDYQAVEAVMSGLGAVPMTSVPLPPLSTYIVGVSSKHVDNSEGKTALLHAGDTLVLQGGPTGIRIRKTFKNRQRAHWIGGYGDWGAWRTSVIEESINAGQTKTYKNNETDTSDDNMMFELIEVVKPASEVEAERKQQTWDEVLKDPNATPEAKAQAKAEYEAARKRTESEAAANAAIAQQQQTAAYGQAFKDIGIPIAIIGGAALALYLIWQYTRE